MHKYYAQNMHQICKKENAQDMPLHRLQHAKYVENMQAIYINMQ